MPKRFPLFPHAPAAHFRIGGSLAEGLQALLKSRAEYQVLPVWSPEEILQQPARDRSSCIISRLKPKSHSRWSAQVVLTPVWRVSGKVSRQLMP